MPRYFFNTHIGEDVITDLNGEDLRDPDHAWETSRAIIRAMMEDPKNQDRLLAASLVVTDEAGEVVLEFPFAEALMENAPEEPGHDTPTAH
ncbi:DUF6894 family protein [Methylobacterium aquaticum]|jgi:hypothetical protein|uniref:DUF6894 domain-containing protein n=1 Tax=Methylobacterium aquaticum TaxID=270351 RepID=A0A0J6SRS2_9HYPH|nr:hypothetical protein [Methylobacterium aquaticum]KMO36053.1 hypothetical protein VP06_10715 [Methylobacterium aquaticum]